MILILISEKLKIVCPLKLVGSTLKFVQHQKEWLNIEINWSNIRKNWLNIEIDLLALVKRC